MAANDRSARVGQRLIAEEAGVSVATVSNVLNRPDIVAPATRQRILDAMQRLGFVNNEAAASLKRGLVLPDITNPFYAEIARGAAAAAEAAGYGIVLCNSDDDPENERHQFEMLARLRAVGALVVPLTADRDRLDRLRHVGIHLILVDRVANAHDECSVAIDDVQGGVLAARHLLGTRPGALALVNGALSIPQCADRRRGVRAAVAESGADPDGVAEFEVGDMTTTEGRLAAQRMLDDGIVPAGIVCTNDQLAIGVIRGLTERGYAVPADIAVVGYGDLAIAADAPVPLTTVEQPKNELGRAAVQLMLGEIEGAEHRHDTRVFSPSLVIRDSAP